MGFYLIAKSASPAEKRICQTPDGKIWCLYVKYSNSDAGLFCAYSTDDGRTWTEETIVDYGNYLFSENIGSISGDSLNGIHVVWVSNGFGTNPAYQNIHYRKRYSTGVWLSIENITDQASHQQSAHLDVDSFNRPHVLWYGRLADDPYPWALQYTWKAVYWQTIEDVYPGIGYQKIEADDIRISPSGKVYALYDRQLSYGWPPFFNWNVRYKVRDGSWGDEQVISDVQLSGHWNSWAKMAIDSSENLYFTWRGEGWGTNDTTYQILYRQKVSGVMADTVVITDSAYDQGSPIIAMNQDEDIVYLHWTGRIDLAESYSNYKRKVNGSWENTKILDETTLYRTSEGVRDSYFPRSGGISVNRIENEPGIRIQGNGGVNIYFYYPEAKYFAWII